MLWVIRVAAAFIPRRLVLYLIRKYFGHICVRAFSTPYFDLPGYMERWWVFQGKRFFGTTWSCRLHCTLRSDMDRFLHDHPYDNVSVILQGEYLEVMPDYGKKEYAYLAYLWGDHGPTKGVMRYEGDIVVRKAEDAHQLILREQEPEPVWSLFFIRTDKKRRWGFHTDRGWVYWKYYVDPATLAPEELLELAKDETKSSGETYGIVYGKRHRQSGTPEIRTTPSRSALREAVVERLRREAADRKRRIAGSQG